MVPQELPGPVLGSLALRLGALGHPGRFGAPGPGGQLSVSFVERELPTADRVRLGDSELRLSPAAPGREREPDSAGIAWLDGPVEALAELDDPQDFPGLHALATAYRNATRPLGVPGLLGVLNVTPDSFSDGGRFVDPAAALDQARHMATEGAAMLDVGGESTRPGSAAVTAEEELRRVIPVIEAIRDSGLPPVSVDTTKSSVARAALAAGASMVNDVSAGRLDPGMVDLVAEQGCSYLLMHMLGTPRNMQAQPQYGNVVREVIQHLRERSAVCVAQGVRAERLLVDPGIGFGKRLEHNLALLNALPELRSLGFPVVLGVSRKRFLRELTGTEVAAERDTETIAAVTAGTLLGADLLRVHDVAPSARALSVAAAIRAGTPAR